MKKFFVFLFIAACFLSFDSCSKKNEAINFQPLEKDALEPGVEWLLVTSPYAACYKDSDYNAEVTGHLRRGEIRKLEGSAVTKTDEVYENWYFVKEGWIAGNSAKVYSNMLKAESAGKQLN